MTARSLCVLLLLAAPASAAAPPAQLTSEQRAQVSQRDRHLRQMAARLLEMDLDGAMKKLQQAIEAQRQVHGDNNAVTAQLLGELARFHDARGQRRQGANLRQQKADILARLYGRAHWRAVDAQLDIAEARTERRSEEETERLFEASQLHIRAVMLDQQGRFREAVPLMRRAMTTYRRLLGEKSRLLVTALGNMGRLHEALGERQEAMRYLKQSADLARQIYGEEHPEYAHTLKNLAIGHSGQGQHAEALKLYLRAGQVIRRSLGEETAQYAEVLDSLGRTYKEMGDLDLALAPARRAVHLARQLDRGKGPNLSAYLNNLAVLHMDRGEYRLAEPLYHESLKLQHGLGGERWPGYASGLNNLARLHEFRGELRQALSLYERSLAILKKVRGEKHPTYLMTLGNMAALLLEMGDRQRAVRVARQALRLAEKAGGEDNPAFADLLNTLGLVHYQTGDYREAVRLFEQARRVQAEKLPDQVATALAIRQNLAGAHAALRDDERTVRHMEAAIRLSRKHHGDDHPRHAALLVNLARIYLGLNEARPALRRATQAYEVLRRREVSGERLLGPLSTMAVANYRLGRHDEALALYQRGLQLSGGKGGPRSQAHINQLFGVGLLYLEMGKPGAGLPYMGQAVALERDRFQAVAAVLSDRQRQAALSEASVHFQHFLSFGQDVLPAGVLYDWAISYRDLGALAAAQQRLARSDRTLAPLFEELQDVRAGLARLAGQPVSPGWHERFDRLVHRKNDLQGQLATASAAGLFEPPTARRVAAALPERSALVEFLVYDHAGRQDARTRRNPVEPRLLAFVLRRDREPAAVPLGAFRPIESALARWRQRVADRDTLLPDPATAAELRRLLWQPIEKYLAGASTLLIVPDGPLCSLPFAALPGRKPGSYLLEEHAIGYLTSGRQLLLPAPCRHGEGLLALGGVDYGTAARPTWARLPGADRESAAVEAVFRAAFPKAVTRRLSGEDARRDELLTLLARKGRPWQCVHLATHGHFARPRDTLPPAALAGWAVGAGGIGQLPALGGVLAAALAAGQPGFDLVGQRDRVRDNPLLLCGLVTAGANRYGSDTILTAEEIASLDLEGTDLVVLSACETGLGTLAGWEGVKGFQQAFHQAGVGTVVSSLWNVSDPATSVLMDEFYDQLWRKKKPPLQALRLAQLAVLNDPGRVRKRADELRAGLIKRGVSERELEERGILAKARKRPPAPVGKGPERSPVAWWAAFVLSGKSPPP